MISTPGGPAAFPLACYGAHAAGRSAALSPGVSPSEHRAGAARGAAPSPLAAADEATRHAHWSRVTQQVSRVLPKTRRSKALGLSSDNEQPYHWFCVGHIFPEKFSLFHSGTFRVGSSSATVIDVLTSVPGARVWAQALEKPGQQEAERDCVWMCSSLPPTAKAVSPS